MLDQLTWIIRCACTFSRSGVIWIGNSAIQCFIKPFWEYNDYQFFLFGIVLTIKTGLLSASEPWDWKYWNLHVSSTCFPSLSSSFSVTDVMNTSFDCDVEHLMVQLDGSDRSPRAPKVISTNSLSMLVLTTCISIRQSSDRCSRWDATLWSVMVDSQAWQTL